MTARGVTFDTGILIALERGKRAARELLASLIAGRRRITVPVAVIVEWWRGSPLQTQLRKVLTVEDMNERIARAAGMALGAVPTATAIDATVMASAAISGDTSTRPTSTTLFGSGIGIFATFGSCH
jgi:predicted nucleic acid-binding protein